MDSSLINHKIRGAALVMVLFIAATLASISVLLIVKTKQHINRIEIAKHFMQAERDLQTDLSHFIFSTQTSPYAILGDSSLSPSYENNLPKDINLRGKPFTFRKSVISIQDMGALIPINPLDRDLMMRYLNHIGWPQEQIHRFLALLADWQDKDSLVRLNGGETSSYKVFGYPLNQPLQSVNELALLAGVDPVLLKNLAQDKNLMLYSAGRVNIDYAPDVLLPIYHTDFDANAILAQRKKNEKINIPAPAENYSSGNWIIQVKTSYEQGKSSKILHLLRRFGEPRPFVISHWQERAR